MKILITSDAFYPMVNGVVTSTNNLYKELKGQGHDVRILTLSYDGNEKIDGDIYYLRSISLKIYPGAKIKNYLVKSKIINSIIEWGPDIVHSQTEFSMMGVSKKIAKELCIPHLHTYHTMYEDYLTYLFNGKLISRKTAIKLISLLLNSIDEIIAPTEKTKNALEDYGVKKNIDVVPTGIDLSQFRQKVSEQEKAELLHKYEITGSKVLVYVGRIAKEKNIEEIISMFSNIVRRQQDINLLIVGGGPYLNNLKVLVSKMKLGDKIKFTGMVEPKEIYKYYQLGNVFVTASTSETQGLTYIEAFANRLPIICRYDSCIEEVVINGINGFTYNDEKQFEKAVFDLLSSNEQIIKMGNEAYKKADEYSSYRFGNRIFNVYKELVNKQMILNSNINQYGYEKQFLRKHSS